MTLLTEHNQSTTTIETISNGMRVVCMCHPDARAEYFGVLIPVGSRAETPEQYGLAHFVEHTLFKGTQRRRAWHILNRMEVLGGELNAYTTKEETAVYTAFPAGNLDRAADLLGDLLANSQFPAAELDKEREVVADEINSYLDSPADAVFDDFDDLLFAGNGLGHNILGTVDRLNTFDTAACRQWLDTYYRPASMVAYYSGPLNARQAIKKIDRGLSIIDRPGMAPARPKPTVQQAVAEPFDRLRNIPSHQCHTIVGAQIGGVYSDNRHAMALLNNILGGPAMNSLLNVQLRERRGLVYTVESSTSIYSDTGVLSIYYGCDPDDNATCRRLILRQLDHLANTPLTQRQAQQYIEQYIGQMMMSAENREQLAMGRARALTYFDHFFTLDELAARIRAITPQQLQDAAQQLLRTSTLSFAPPKT